MQIKALTIVAVFSEEPNKPPDYTLVGTLPAEVAFSVLHNYLLQTAREQGKRESDTSKEVNEGNQ